MKKDQQMALQIAVQILNDIYKDGTMRAFTARNYLCNTFGLDYNTGEPDDKEHLGE